MDFWLFLIVLTAGSWCFYSSAGTHHTIPRRLLSLLGPYAQKLVHLVLSQNLFVLVLGHFALSQEPWSKCWDTSYCPRTFRPGVGTLHTVPRPSVGHLALSQDPSLKRWDTSHCSKTPTQVLGHSALSQDPSLECWDI